MKRRFLLILLNELDIVLIYYIFYKINEEGGDKRVKNKQRKTYPFYKKAILKFRKGGECI